MEKDADGFWTCPRCRVMRADKPSVTAGLNRDQTALAILQTLVAKAPHPPESNSPRKLAEHAVHVTDCLLGALGHNPTVLQNNRFEAPSAQQVPYKDLAVGDRYTLPADLSDPEGVWLKLTDYRCVCVSSLSQGDKSLRAVNLGSTHPETMVTRYV